MAMKTGIIGLPQVGKTSLFKILTRVNVEDRGYSREAHLGMATVPDDRLDRLAAQYNPKKLTHATVEYSDVAAIGQEALKETAFLTSLRNVDALIHVLRAFEDDAIAHVGAIDPLRDAKSVEFDLMLSDLTQVEKRLERLEKDLKKMRTPDLEKENALLIRCKASLEEEKPLREMEMTPEEKKLIRGFMFLSQKPVLYAVNVSESMTLGADLEAAAKKYGLEELAARPNAGVTAFCGKVEAELSEMEDEEAKEFLASYGLTESGLVRLIRRSYELLGLISFFTIGEDECRAWTVPANSRAQEAAGAIHTDLEAFHSGGDDPLGHAAGGWVGGSGAGAGDAAAGGQRLFGAGRGCSAYQTQRVRQREFGEGRAEGQPKPAKSQRKASELPAGS
jgi:GTP-binding protein YchF